MTETLTTTLAARYLIPGDVVKVLIGTMTVQNVSICGNEWDADLDTVTLLLDGDDVNPIIWTVPADFPVDTVSPMPEQAEPAWVAALNTPSQESVPC